MGRRAVRSTPGGRWAERVVAALINDQEVINPIMTRAHPDSRMVCRRERTTGSNMPQSVCLTVAQRRKAQEDSRKALNDSQRFNNYKP